MSCLRHDFFAHLAQTSPEPIGLDIERAEGAWLITTDGRRYLDLISGIGVSNLGHGEKAVVEAIQGQLARHLHVMVYGEYIIETQVRLAARLAHLLPARLSRVYFTNSGAEAIEGALKVARKYTRRTAFVAFDGAYHGDTMAALALAGNRAFRAPFGPLPGPVLHLPYDECAALDAIDGSIAAVVIEPVQAEGGVRIPSLRFMQDLRQQCDRVGALLIFDEVLTGMGRTGKLFALEHFGVEPDIVVLAKALGGGLPLGAFCGADALIGCLASDPPLGHITTFGGHPLSCAAGLAALDTIVERRLSARAAQLGVELLDMLAGLVDGRHVVGVRGLGLLLGIEFAAPALSIRFARRMLDEGVIVNWTLNADRVVRLAPPLTITEAEVAFAEAAIRHSINQLDRDNSK